MNLLSWLYKTPLILVAMCIDNYCWITASPEWLDIEKNFKLINIGFLEFPIPINKKGFSYVLHQRIIPVLTNWRDLVPAVLVGGVWSLL